MRNAITINHDFKTLIPPLASEEKEQLEANILRDGCREALVTWNGILVDGHNRYDICTRHGIEFDVKEMEFATRDEVELWIINNQTGRRNIHPLDKVPLIERKRGILERQARERMEAGENQHSSPPQNFTEASTKTGEVNESLAAEIGVSRPTYEALKTVSEEGTPELKQAVRDKRVGASTAAQIATLPAETQAEIVSKPTRSEIVEEVRKHVHVAANSGNNEWYTPTRFLEAARDVLGTIDLDPASCELANQNVQAATFYTEQDDGLSKSWTGNVWMNPPYAQPLIEDFCTKLVEEYKANNVKAAIALVNNGTETKWGQALLSNAAAVCFPASRIKFLDTQGNPTGAPLQGQMIIYLGKKPRDFTETFSIFGACRLK